MYYAHYVFLLQNPIQQLSNKSYHVLFVSKNVL